MANYRFNPADPRVTFATSPSGVMHRSGCVVDCSPEFAATVNSSYPGVDGAAAMTLLDAPQPAPARKRRRKSKAGG